MSYLAKFVKRYPAVIVAITIVITAFSIIGITRVRVDTSQRGFFPSDAPEVAALDRVDEAFGGSDYIMIASPSDEVFTPEGLALLSELTSRLEMTDGVNSVNSIATMSEVRSAPWGLDVVQMLGDIPSDQDGADEVRRRMLESEQLRGVLISEDGDYVLTLAQLGMGVDAGKLAGEVKLIVHEVMGDRSYALSGAPMLNRSAEEHLLDDLVDLLPGAAAIILLTLITSFQTAAGVVLPLLTVVLSIVWTLGIMGFVGIPLTQMSAVLPVALLSSGSAYGIHMMHRYYEEINVATAGTGLSAAGAAAPLKAIESVGVAIVLAGVTTVAGFGSNIFSTINRMRDFGMLAAIGIACALLISLTFLPAVLVLMARRGRQNARALARNGAASEKTSGVMRRFGDAVLRNPIAVIVAVAALVVWSGVGVGKLGVDTDFASFFDARSVTRRDFDLIRSEFGGVDTVQVMVEGDILDPATLRAMEQAGSKLEQVDGLGRALSIVDVIKQVSMALHDGDPAWNRVPDTRDEAAQYVLLVSMSGDVGIDAMLSLDQTQARIQVMADSTMNSRAGGGTLDEARAIVRDLAAAAPTIESVEITGLPLLGEAMGSQIVTGQMQSLVLAALSVLAIVYLSLGRSWDSLMCMAPIVLTILANFGLMGWAGLPVNLVTALVSSIAVGMGIDYSVHIYTSYSQRLAAGAGPRDAMRATIAYTGRAVVLNSAAVAAGFLVMMTSEFPPVRQFGLLISVTMVVSSLGALTVLPAMLVAARERRSKRGVQI